MSFLSLFFSGLVCFALAASFTSCGDDDDGADDNGTSTKNYSAAIMMPDAEDKNVNDVIHIHVNFDEANAEAIENIRVTIQPVNEAIENPTIIYDKPDANAINEAGGHAEHHDDFFLNVAADTDWVIKAYVWEGDASEFDEDRGVVVERQFHVNP